MDLFSLLCETGEPSTRGLTINTDEIDYKQSLFF